MMLCWLFNISETRVVIDVKDLILQCLTSIIWVYVLYCEVIVFRIYLAASYGDRVPYALHKLFYTVLLVGKCVGCRCVGMCYFTRGDCIYDVSVYCLYIKRG